MKWSKKILAFLLILVLSIAILPVTNVSAAKKVKLNKTKATIYVGKTVTLKLKNNKKKVKWSTSNKKIATVSKKGKVKGKKAGKATITVKAGKKKYKCKIIVKNNVSANYDILKNYLYKYGRTNDTGENYYISKTIEANNSSTIVSILYNSSKEQYLFESYSFSDDKDSSASLSMEINPTNIKSAYISFRVISGGYGEAHITLDAKNYNGKKTQNFVIDENRYMSEGKVNELANLYLQASFSGWKYLLSDIFDMKMSDLGFASYK